MQQRKKKRQETRTWEFLSRKPSSTSWNHICGAPSKVQHFPNFPYAAAHFPPSLKRLTSFFLSGFFSLQSHTNHRLGASVLATNRKNGLPWQQNWLPGGPQRQRVLVTPTMQITPSDTLGSHMMLTYRLPHWLTCKHNAQLEHLYVIFYDFISYILG